MLVKCNHVVVSDLPHYGQFPILVGRGVRVEEDTPIIVYLKILVLMNLFNSNVFIIQYVLSVKYHSKGTISYYPLVFKLKFTRSAIVRVFCLHRYNCVPFTFYKSRSVSLLPSNKMYQLKGWSGIFHCTRRTCKINPSATSCN